MKLRNKRTGEIVDFRYLQSDHVAPLVLTIYENDKPEMYKYNSLTELTEEWEDYEEPKKHYEILAMGAVMEREDAEDEIFRNQGQKEIGNYFKTKEEAEQAVEKLKAWKRLKDRGFRFVRIDEQNEGHRVGQYIEFEMAYHFEPDAWQIGHDLDLLFGGEE